MQERVVGQCHGRAFGKLSAHNAVCCLIRNGQAVDRIIRQIQTVWIGIHIFNLHFAVNTGVFRCVCIVLESACFQKGSVFLVVAQMLSESPLENTSVKGGSFPGRAGIGFTDISPQIKCLVGEWYKGDRQICFIIRADTADTAEFSFTDTACGTVTVEETADTALGQDLYGCIYACAQPAGTFGTGGGKKRNTEKPCQTGKGKQQYRQLEK